MRTYFFFFLNHVHIKIHRILHVFIYSYHVLCEKREVFSLDMENNEQITNIREKDLYRFKNFPDWKWYFEFYYVHVSSLVCMGMKQCL